MQVLSSNGLEISLDVSVLYQPKYSELGLLHKTKGENYVNIVLIPQIRAVARSVVGRYTPEQLYSTKRDAIQNEIFEETQKNVESQHIQVNAVLVRDVTLPVAIKEAIERKLRQEQEALEYEFRIEKAKQEAERQRIDAEGKATANRILSASSILDYVFRELAISYLGKEELAHTPSISSSKNISSESTDEKFIKIVKNITSKGFVRSNLEEKLVDLSDVRINLKTKN